MNKIWSLFLLLALIIFACQKEDVGPDPDDSVIITDNIFLSELIERGIDTDRDNKISKAEAEKVTYLKINNVHLNSMTGIEAFVNLETLILKYVDITSLDVSNSIALKYLDCSCNFITDLNVSGNIELTYLDCSTNQLSSLNVGNNTVLDVLHCNDNVLTSLDLSACTALTILHCERNQISTLDVSNITALVKLSCNWNQLSSLDVSNNTTFLTRINIATIQG